MWILVFCFFKQKTAYELRISDWSSDVCSSDLRDLDEQHRPVGHRHRPFGKAEARRDDLGRAEAAHSDFGRGALRKSAALKPSGAAISTIGSSRASYSMRSARVITACMS